MFFFFVCVFFFKKKTAYEMRISDWSSDVCSSDLAAIEKLKGDAIDEDAIAALLGASLVAPVLTAHPTEVRRKSVLDHKNRVAELMRMRDAGLDETPEGDVIEEPIRRQVVLLWQTRPMRTEKLFVADEIDNALTYLRNDFLPVVPKLYARWEKELGTSPAPFLTVCSWIGAHPN